MPQVRLNDQLFKDAERRASEAGFSAVDNYVADLLNRELTDAAETFDRLFTPERLAKIDAAAAQIDSGQFFTAEQADQELSKRRAEWLQKRPG
jgi:hypothetical protein